MEHLGVASAAQSAGRRLTRNISLVERHVEIFFEPRRFEISIDDQHTLALEGEHGGHVGERHRSANASFI